MLLVRSLSRWGWCLLWRGKRKTEWILLPCLENGATGWKFFLLSMERLLLKSSQWCSSSRNDLALLLKGATTSFLVFPWCGCTFSSLEEMILLLLKGTIAPVLAFPWCDCTFSSLEEMVLLLLKGAVAPVLVFPWCGCTFSYPEEMVLLLLKSAAAPVLAFPWYATPSHL